MRVEVRDYVNSKRLLGYIVNPPQTQGSYLYLSVLPKLLPVAPTTLPEVSPTLDTRRVDLAISWLTESNGYVRRAVFQTSDSLENLLRVPSFRLPGETEAEAYQRLRS